MRDLHDKASIEIEEEEKRKKRRMAITEASRSLDKLQGSGAVSQASGINPEGGNITPAPTIPGTDHLNRNTSEIGAINPMGNGSSQGGSALLIGPGTDMRVTETPDA